MLRPLMRSRLLGTAIAALMLAAAAPAQDPVERTPAPVWVAPARMAEPVEAREDFGARILMLDAQYRDEGDRQHMYVRTRTVATTPQGLAALGSVAMVWAPASQQISVHQVNLVRGGETIDVLASQSFEMLRRESNLEQSMLDGAMTAVLQPAGLRVGDILDVAYTVTSRDPVLAGHASLSQNLNVLVPVDWMRYRASWPQGKAMRLQGPEGWNASGVRREGAFSTIELVRTGVEPILPLPDAPGRIYLADTIEMTDYADWSDLAASLKPLYDKARVPAENSPLRAEIERIRAVSDDPATQAAAALRLVQDEVRYVALLMGEGALTPASADETWERRFGDCKGKTALLLALLDGLGIPAEPAAASLLQGDGLDQRLPSVGVFDHVLVRAEVDGQIYWLDGTRQGDRQLRDIQPPRVSWALPLIEDARPQRIALSARDTPSTDTVIALDATAGLHAPAKVEATTVVRGEQAALYGGQMSLISAGQRDQLLRGVWEGYFDDLDIAEVRSAYDVEANVLTWSMRGSTRLSWTGGLVPPGATYMPLTAAERPAGRFAEAPYRINHPEFEQRTVTVKLPDAGRGFSVAGGVFDREEFGHHVKRSAELDGDTVTIGYSARSLVPEISTSQADADRTAARTRLLDRPTITAPRSYQLTEQDRAAWAADEPTTANAWLDRAYTLSSTAAWPEAAAAAAKAIELDPESSAAWANRGVYRFHSGDRDGAVADLEKAVDIDPSERIAMNGHALIALAEARYDDAVIELSRALRQKPGDEFALTRRAEAYTRLQQWDRALRDIDAILAAHPDHAHTKMLRVSILRSAGRFDEADEDMARLAEGHPQAELVQIDRAITLWDDGDGQGAIDLLTRLIERSPQSDVQARSIRARIAVNLDQYALADADIDAIRNAHVDNAQARGQLCALASEVNHRLDDLLVDCEAARRLAPGDPAYRLAHGWALLAKHDYAAALAAFDAPEADSPAGGPWLFGRGIARIGLGDNEGGEADKAAGLARGGIREIVETVEAPLIPVEAEP